MHNYVYQLTEVDCSTKERLEKEDRLGGSGRKDKMNRCLHKKINLSRQEDLMWSDVSYSVDL